MQIYPLSFNKVDFDRNLALIGKLSKSALPGEQELFSLWSEQVKKPIFDNKYEVIKPEPVARYEGNPADYLDKTFGLVGGGEKMQVVFLGDVRSWDMGIIEYLLAESRPRKLMAIMEVPDLASIQKELAMAIWGCTATLAVGDLSQTDIQFIHDTHLFDGYVDRVLAKTKEQYAMVYSQPKGVVVFEGSRAVTLVRKD